MVRVGRVVTRYAKVGIECCATMSHKDTQGGEDTESGRDLMRRLWPLLKLISLLMKYSGSLGLKK